MSFKTRDGKTHQSSVIFGENGLPIDAIATISGSYVFLDGTDAFTYNSGSATVTLPAGYDLTEVTTAKARYTGKYILLTNDGRIYYIDRQSIDIANRTFKISKSDKAQITPTAVDTGTGWVIAEADIVNRMATTAAAKVDSIEFRDMHFQMELDGDPVSILNADDEKINPSTEEKQDDQIVELGLINDELDTIRDNQTNKTQHTQITNGTHEAKVDSDLNLHVESHGDDPQGVKSVQPISGVVASNSTSTPLLANETFTGSFVDCSKYASVAVTILTDQSSAPDGSVLEFSVDGTNAGIIRKIDTTNPPSLDGIFYSIPCEAKFFRVSYTNGGTDQSVFLLETELKSTLVGPATVPLIAPLIDTISAPLNRSVITGRSTSGEYLNRRSPGISAENSTSTPLGANETFTGAFKNVLGYSNVALIINTDVESAVDGAEIQWSTDGVNVDGGEVFTKESPFLKGIHTFGVMAKFFRVVYINGPTAQTHFRMQSIFHIERPKPSSHRINDTINGQNDAELVKSVIAGKDEIGAYQNIGTSPSGSLKVAITDRPSEVRGRLHVDKNIEFVTLDGTGTIIHTVTAGKTFYLTSMIVSAINNVNTTGRYVIRDNTVNKIPYIIPEKGVPSSSTSPPLPEPIPFTTDVRVTSIQGDITVSVTIVGYEENE